MHVLIGSKRAPGRKGRRDGGVQTWVSTVRDELLRLGHAVSVCDAVILPTTNCDAAILSNPRYSKYMASLATRVTYVCHGIVEDERPEQNSVFTSEQVAAHWQQRGPVIRQPLDLDYWSPSGERDPNLIVRYANRNGLTEMPQTLDGYEYKHLRNVDHGEARKWLRRAGCVLATGRAAIEAMACGAPVIICDNRPYQGPLMHTGTLWDAMRANYSGRGGSVPNRRNILEQVELCIGTGQVYRDWVCKYHDVRRVVPLLLGAGQ